jgi:hypothetical protein
VQRGENGTERRGTARWLERDRTGPRSFPDGDSARVRWGEALGKGMQKAACNVARCNQRGCYNEGDFRLLAAKLGEFKPSGCVAKMGVGKLAGFLSSRVEQLEQRKYQIARPGSDWGG